MTISTSGFVLEIYSLFAAKLGLLRGFDLCIFLKSHSATSAHSEVFPAQTPWRLTRYNDQKIKAVKNPLELKEAYQLEKLQYQPLKQDKR